MRSTMMDFPLTIGHIFAHGRALYADSDGRHLRGRRRRAASSSGPWPTARTSWRPACAAWASGPATGSPPSPGTTPEHQEAYFAIPGMGAVMHTLNIRLSAEQIRYIIGHAEDSVIIADASLAPVLGPVLADGGDEVKTLRHLIVYGDGDRSALPGRHRLRGTARRGAARATPGRRLDETSAAAMCYTSGTTGLPKGVVYSHRSTFLHTLGVCSGEALGLSQYDRLLPVVPMFHGNAWGMPYAAWLVGADLLLPNRFTQADPLAAVHRGGAGHRWPRPCPRCGTTCSAWTRPTSTCPRCA